MYLYLIRHGIATDPDPFAVDKIATDEQRSLTKLGRKKVEQVADRLVNLEVKFDLIITSPLVRARQTADILLDKQLSSKIEVSQALKPDRNLPDWLVEWAQRSIELTNISQIALVGHEPNLSQWAELLIFGKVCDRLVLKKGGIIGLKFEENRIEIGTARLCCLLSPKYLI